MARRSLSRWVRFLRALTGEHRGRQPAPVGFRPIIESLELREVPSTSTWIGGGFDNICAGHRPTGSDPSAWNNSLNWEGGHVPGPGDTAAFPAPFVIARCPNDVIAPFNNPVVNVNTTIASAVTQSGWQG